MSSSPMHWRELITQSGFSCPKLFYKFSGDDQGYKILFTDLVGLWSESLDPESIHQFAKQYHTSIDPSQSRKQFQVLLQKLELSLSSGTNNLFHDEDFERKSVVLSTTTNLPKPLQPLKWRFHLKPETSSEMAEHILRPSLHEASESKRKLDSLHEIIDQKDHVISRLLERIDNSSLDLSLIFPRISRLKAKNGVVTSKEAQNQVPGLGKFNRSTWNDKFQSDGPYTGFQAQGLANLVAGCEKCPQHTAKRHEQWLRRLQTTPMEVSSSRDDGAHENQEKGTSTSSDSDNDEFETQQRKRSYDHALAADSTSNGSDTIRNRSFKQIKLGKYQQNLNEQDFSIKPIQSQHEQRRDPNESTASNDSGDLALPPLKPDSGKRARLGQLGNKPKSIEPLTGYDEKGAQRMLPLLSSSSPPPQASKPRPRNISDNKPLGSSSPTTSSLNPSTPRKLGRLKSQKISNSATPEKSPSKRDTTVPTSIRDREASIPITPTRRRLGRLGASRGTTQTDSQAQVLSEPQTQPQHLHPANTTTVAAQKTTIEHSDSDASTSSTASENSASPRRQRGVPPPRLLPQESSVEFSTQIHGVVHGGGGGGGGGVKIAEKAEDGEEGVVELTKEEKAIRRRQELQKKIEPSSGGGNAQMVRKRRKF